MDRRKFISGSLAALAAGVGPRALNAYEYLSQLDGGGMRFVASVQLTEI